MTTRTDNDALSPVDRAALERAIETCRTQKGPAARDQIERKLANEPWFTAARFAAYSCQMDSLRLRPWQEPPCWIDDPEADIAAGDDGVIGQFQAAKLLQRLLDAKLSRYEPDPIAALAAARKRPPTA
jgi:hypothetical protein